MSKLKEYKMPLTTWYKLPALLKKNIPAIFINRNNELLKQIILDIVYKNKGCIVIIGANDGLSFDPIVPDLVNFMVKHNLTKRSYFIEPTPYYFGKLTKNMQCFNEKGMFCICYNKALHPEKEKEIIYMVDPVIIEKGLVPNWVAGCPSFSCDFLVKQQNIDPSYIIKQEVECVTFSDLVEMIKNETGLNKLSLDYLQIDTEGFDDKVIEMIDFETVEINVLKYEKANLSEHALNKLRQRLSKYFYFIDFGMDDICFNKLIFKK